MLARVSLSDPDISLLKSSYPWINHQTHCKLSVHLIEVNLYLLSVSSFKINGVI